MCVMRDQCEQLIDYFNGQLNAEEEKAFEKHLEECSDCKEELEELREATADLPFSVEPVEPPSEMKERVLAGVFASTEEPEETTAEDTQTVTPAANPTNLNERKQEKEQASRNTQKQRRTVKPWMVTTLAAALLLSLIGNVYTFMSDPDQPAAIPDTETIDEVLTTVQMSGEQSGNATAAILKQKDDLTLLVNADQLEGLEGDEVYQVWLLEGETPYRAGSFVTNEKGEGAVAFSLQKLQNKNNWDAIAISKEPNANSETPQGNIVLSSKF